LAEEIYLNVIPITNADGTLQEDGDGEAVEYAVRMNEFDQQCLLDYLLEQKRISLEHMEQLADALSAFHQRIAIAGTDLVFGNSAEVIKPVEQNFSVLQPILPNDNDLQKLMVIKNASMEIYTAIREKLDERKRQGFIRECHGDMHLGNIALIDDRILIFGGIEFNDSFKWIDTMSELAFLVMDLQDHGEVEFANHVLNRYLQNTGDYTGMAIFRFYQLYRAMVRAKVTGLRLRQQKRDSEPFQHDQRILSDYLDLAIEYIRPAKIFVAVTHGLSGSGKSWLSTQLARQTGAIVVRSDLERKRLFAEHENLYSNDITRQTYQHLLSTCQLLIHAGYPVIADATFLDKHWRRLFLTLARSVNADFHILACHADQATLEKRIQQRATQKDNISDADIKVMKSQIKKDTAFDKEELSYVVDIDTAKDTDIYALIDVLLKEC
jgi:aminoglycoside phosphotransferase family enzyme/predicted kinase